MGHVSRAKAEKIVSAAGWLTQVPEAFRAEVLRWSILQHFAAGETIIRLGEPAGGIYGLVTGTVSVNIAPAGSSPRLIHLGAPGHWTGEACFLTRMPRRGDVRAAVPTSMFHLPLGVMDQMAAADPAVFHYFSLILMMSVETLIRVIHDLQKPEAARRIASVLQRGTWIGDEPIPLSQTEIGVMANASRKQVNAALKRFAEAGWVANTYRSVTIRDAKALRRFAEEDYAD